MKLFLSKGDADPYRMKNKRAGRHRTIRPVPFVVAV
jgi:hypothetical protein